MLSIGQDEERECEESSQPGEGEEHGRRERRKQRLAGSRELDNIRMSLCTAPSPSQTKCYCSLSNSDSAWVLFSVVVVFMCERDIED